MKKIISLVLFLCMLLTLFAACGKQKPSDGNAGSSTDTPSAGTDTEPEKDTKITANPPSSFSKTVNIGIWGDSVINVHAIEDTMRLFAINDGFDICFSAYIYNDHGKNSAYQLYELFDWNSTDADGTIKGFAAKLGTKGNRLAAVLDDPSENYDYFIVDTGRDSVTVEGSGSSFRCITAMEYLYKAFKEKMPDCKLVFFEPPAFEKNGFRSQRIKLTAQTYDEHNALIKDYSKRLSQKIGGDHLTAAVGDAFAFFMENYSDTGINLFDASGDFQSEAGSYFTAALVYSVIFGQTTYGSEVYGFIDKESAEILQKAAHRFVFGSEPSAPAEHKGYATLGYSFKESDPRTQTVRDPRFENEVYPEGYAELFAAAYSYFARGVNFQYDKTALVNKYSLFYRREPGRTPESVSTQNVLFNDCSGLCDAIYTNCFDYDLGVDTSDMINLTEGQVFFWNGANPDLDWEEAAQKLLATLQPGDVIIQRVQSGGHAMLYIGNGWIMHCTNTHAGGDMNDYNYDAKSDSPEPFGGIMLSKIDVVTDPKYSYFTFTSSYKVNVVRPLSLGLTANDSAKVRAANLAGVIACKESSVYKTVTASRGEEVEFAYVLRNDTDAAVKISLFDKLPEGMRYVSGDVAFTGGVLDTEAEIPANSTLRLCYKAVIEAENGTEIPCADTVIGGLPANATPIYVAETLRDKDAEIYAAATGVTASSDVEYINAVYEKAFGYVTPITSAQDFISSTFDFNGDAVAAISNPILVNEYYFGGIAVRFMANKGSGRITDIKADNLLAGDVIAVMTDQSSISFLLCVGYGKLASFESGSLKILSAPDAVNRISALLGEYAFCILRPSKAEEKRSAPTAAAQAEVEVPADIFFVESGMNTKTYNDPTLGKLPYKSLIRESGTCTAVFNVVPDTYYRVEVEGAHDRFRIYGKRATVALCDTELTGDLFMDGIISDNSTTPAANDTAASAVFFSGEYRTVFIYLCQKNYYEGKLKLKVFQIGGEQKMPEECREVTPRTDISLWAPPEIEDQATEIPDLDYEGFLNETYEKLREEYPDYVKREIIGKDASGKYDIYAYTFIPENPEKSCWLQSGVHPREVDAWTALSLFMKEICENETKSEYIDYLRNKVAFYVVPAVNVWGVSQPRADRYDWNSNDVNINRDTDKKEQAETVAVTGFFDSVKDKLNFAIDFHTTVNNSYGDYMLTAFTGERSTLIMKDTALTLAEKNKGERLDSYKEKRKIKGDNLWLPYFGDSLFSGTYAQFFRSQGVPGGTVEHSDYVWDDALATVKTLTKAVENIGNQVIRLALNDF